MKTPSMVLVLVLMLAGPALSADEIRQTPAAGAAVNLEGSVESIDDPAGSGPRTLVVRDGQGRRHTVWLSPRWLVERQRLELAAGHLVRVEGTECTRGLVVHRLEDRTTGKTVTLREADGTPKWSAGPKGGRRSGLSRGYRCGACGHRCGACCHRCGPCGSRGRRAGRS